VDFLSVAGFALNLYAYFQDHPETEESNVLSVPIEKTVVQPQSIVHYPLSKIAVSELLQNNFTPAVEKRKLSLAEKVDRPEQKLAPKQRNKKLTKQWLWVAKKRYELESGVDNNGLYFLRKKRDYQNQRRDAQ
jgi:hypothetical protein